MDYLPDSLVTNPYQHPDLWTDHDQMNHDLRMTAADRELTHRPTVQNAAVWPSENQVRVGDSWSVVVGDEVVGVVERCG